MRQSAQKNVKTICMMAVCGWFLVTMITDSGFAVTKTYDGPTTGNWEVPQFWLPFGKPGPNDTVVFDREGNYFVDVSAGAVAEDVYGVAGKVTLEGNANFQEVFMEDFGSELVLRTGLYSLENVYVADDVGSQSTVELVGANTIVEMNDLYPGYNGDGIVRIDGANVDINRMVIGQNFGNGGTGDLDIIGATSLVTFRGDMGIEKGRMFIGNGAQVFKQGDQTFDVGNAASGFASRLDVVSASFVGFGDARIAQGSEIQVDDGLFDIDGFIEGNGRLDLDSGLIGVNGIRPSVDFDWGNGVLVVYNNFIVGGAMSSLPNGLNLNAGMELVVEGSLTVAEQTIRVNGGPVEATVGLILRDGGTLELEHQFDLTAVNNLLTGTGTVEAGNGATPQLINNGSIVADAPGALTIDGHVGGDGTIDGAVVARQHSVGVEISHVEVVDTTYGPTSTLNLEIADVDFYDSLGGDGWIALEGGGISVSLQAGYEPLPGDVFALVQAAQGVTGEFGSFDILGDQSGLGFRLEYTPTEVLLLVESSGDFDFDGELAVNDLDQLVAAIASGSNETHFDLNSDGVVDLLDQEVWLSNAGEANLGPGQSFQLGDANLNGTVDGTDFLSWNNAKFTAVAAWSQGDFNASGFVDGADFLAWNSNKFTSAAPAAVPEPAAVFSFLVAFAFVAWKRRA